MLKRIKWNSIAVAILYIVAGVLLFMYPNTLQNIVCDVIGFAVIIIGIIHIVNYLIMDIRDAIYRDDFVEGVVVILIGVLLVYEKKTFATLVPSILSIFIIISGFSLIQDAIDLHRLGVKGSALYVTLGLIPIVYGILLMFDILKLQVPILKLLGIGLVYCGATKLFSSIHVSTRINKYIKELEKPKEEPKPSFFQQPAPQPESINLTHDVSPIILDNSPQELEPEPVEEETSTEETNTTNE